MFPTVALDLQGARSEGVKPSQLCPCLQLPPKFMGHVLKIKAMLLDQVGEKILAAKCLKRGLWMGKLKKGDVPLSFPLSKLSELAPHILQA